MKTTFASYINFLQRDFLEYTKQQLKEINLTYGQLPLIIYIGKHPNCSQAELTEHLQLDWGYSQRTINKLVLTGFVFKTNTSKNNQLSLTVKGQEAFDLSHHLFFSWDSEALKDLSEEEIKSLKAILQKIARKKLQNLPDYMQSQD